MHHGSTPRFPALFVVFFCLLSPLGLLAQRPGNFQLPKGAELTRGNVSKMMCNSNAGNVARFGDFVMQSNSFGNNIPSTAVRAYNTRPDTIFLCFDDEFSVDMINSTIDLTGDPNTATTPGVGYAFYTCDPTVSGPTLADVVNDPCVADGGLPPFDDLAVGIPLNYASGDYKLTIANDEVAGFTIPALFAMGGSPSPIVLTLAPITFDDADLAVGEPVYEGNPIGECVDVSTDQRFTVAFLNPITLGQLDETPAGCDGLFDVFGGVPELRGNAGYTINIINEVTGEEAVILTPQDEILHSGIVRYRVPNNGTYRITIEDEKSCGLEGGAGRLVTHTNAVNCEQPVVFNLPIDAAQEMTNECFPITVENFNDITAWEMTLQFDQSILEYTGLANPNAALVGNVSANGPANSGGTLPDGNVRIIYFDLVSTPITIPDGETIVELCFNVVGRNGDRSPLIEIAPEAEFTRAPQNPARPVINAGEIVITNEPFLVETTKVNEQCQGGNDGSTTVTASGARGPFTFEIREVTEANFRDAQTRPETPATASFFGLRGNTDYVVRVTDGMGRQVTTNVDIEEGLMLGVRLEFDKEPTCFGDSDGEIRVVVSENTIAVADPVAAGYRIVWGDDPDIRTAERLNVRAMNYAVTVTAPNGVCTNTASGSLDQPARVRVRPDNPANAVSSATCSGSPDGSIDIEGAGGTAPYDFDWPGTIPDDNGVLTSFRAGLVPGNYEVIVTDMVGCTDTANFVVDALKALVINPEVDSIQCFGDGNGVIRGTGSANGAAPVGNFTVELTDPAGAVLATEVITPGTGIFRFENLTPGRYIVVMRDEDPAGCETTDTFDLSQPELLEIDTDPLIIGEDCITGNNGSISAMVSGGTLPYTFRFRNDSLDTVIDTLTPDASLGGLSADTNYVLIVTDANLCTDTLRFRIGAPAGAMLSVIDTSFISCPGEMNGQLSVVATPPPGQTVDPNRITWYRLNADGSLGAPVATGLTTGANLATGNYVVEVFTIPNQCSAFMQGSVVSPGEVFLAAPPTVSNPQCPGDANGSIFLEPGGGTPNADGTYNYVWSTDPNGAPTTNPGLTRLTAGTYTVTITDGNGCQPPFDTTFTLVDPPAIVADFINIDPVSCPDDQTLDGAVTVAAMYSDSSTGVYDFTFTITNNLTSGATQATEMNRGRGPISVRITDGICTESFTDTIPSPPEFDVDVRSESVSCNGLTDGMATAIVTGGTPGYDFDWSNAPGTDSVITGLAAGMGFVLNITDANGCSPDSVTFNIGEPDPLTLSIDPVQTTATVRCAGDMNGRLGIFVSSVNNNPLGDNPYTWSPSVAGSNETLATELSPGTYRVTVTDERGCQDSIVYVIGEPEAITFFVDPPMDPLCFGETTPITVDTAFGGTSRGIGDFTFSVNNDGFRIPVGQTGSAFAGDVVVTVFDSVGCSAEQTFSINQPPEILIDLPERIVVELGDSLTRLNPLISPAGDVYEYLWTSNVTEDYLSSDSVRNPIVVPFESVDYVLRVTNENGCQAFADIFVEVDANRNVFIPNVFSPNRDGRNDDFRIFACQGVRSVNKVQVYDRWGGLLFDESGFDANCLDGIQLWDGLGQNGKLVNPGVFVYVIEVEFLDNVVLVYRGDVTVLR